MSVHKDKNNAWYVKYKNKTKRGFSKKFEAERYEAKLKLSVLDTKNTIYLFNIIDDYLDHTKRRLTIGSYTKIKGVIEKVILPNIINKDINKINELDCRKFRELVQNLSYSTVHKNYILNCYKALFKHARIYFKVTNNPTYVMESFKKTFEEKMKTKNKELNIWNENDFVLFINHIDKEKYKYLFILLFYTGIRLGEALALTWNDYKDNCISITKSLTRKTNKGTYEIKDTKTVSSIRDIELGNNLSSILDTFKKQERSIRGFNKNWFMFGRLAPLPYTSIEREKNNAIKKANVRKIRIHDFRHSHASNLIANGVNIVAVSKRLGHSDINMTLSIYTHLMKDTEEKIIAYIDNSSQNLLNK